MHLKTLSFFLKPHACFLKPLCILEMTIFANSSLKPHTHQSHTNHRASAQNHVKPYLRNRLKTKSQNYSSTQEQSYTSFGYKQLSRTLTLIPLHCHGQSQPSVSKSNLSEGSLNNLLPDAKQPPLASSSRQGLEPRSHYTVAKNHPMQESICLGNSALTVYIYITTWGTPTGTFGAQVPRGL